MEELRSRAFERAHPVEQAGYAHYAFVTVHPFADGNGRVARALASVYLYRSLSIPLVVFAHQKPQYLDALEQADRGDAASWLNFIADRGIDTMQLVGENLRSAVAPRPQQIARRLPSIFGSRGRTPAELDNLAGHLLVALQARWESAIEPLRPRLGRASVAPSSADWPPPEGYRRTARLPRETMMATLTPPAPFIFDLRIPFRVNIALDDHNPFGFQIEAMNSEDRLAIRDVDVSPEVSAHLWPRMDQWIERQLGTKMAELEQIVKRQVDDHR